MATFEIFREQKFGVEGYAHKQYRSWHDQLNPVDIFCRCYNALIQAHFDCGCSSWFLLFKENLKIKFQKAQNKYICFCLNFPRRSRIDPSQFRKRKLHPARDRVEQCIVNTVLSTRMNLYGIFMKCSSPNF